MRVGRNDACPCGSGEKYKKCCEGKSASSRGMMMLIGAIVLIAVIGIISIVLGRRTDAALPPGTAPAPLAAGRPQPGPAPAGKVWSTEHGHWHDAAPGGGQSPIRTSSTTVPIGAPPAQGMPAGQATTQPPATPGAPQPPGPAPAGQVWSTEHGHWHRQ